MTWSLALVCECRGPYVYYDLEVLMKMWNLGDETLLVVFAGPSLS